MYKPEYANYENEQNVLESLQIIFLLRLFFYDYIHNPMNDKHKLIKKTFKSILFMKKKWFCSFEINSVRVIQVL